MATVYEFVTPPVKNATWDFYISLVSQGDTDIFQKSVTLAAGDEKIYQDGVLDGNADTIAAEIGSTGILKVALSADEMNCDSVVIGFSDAAGDEWQDAIIEIKTVQAVTVSDLTQAQIIDDATPFSGGNVDASISSRSDGTGVTLSAAGVDAIWDEVLEGTLDGREILRILLSALAGKSTGGGTVSVAFRDVADGKDRIAATVTAVGNRTAVTLDGS